MAFKLKTHDKIGIFMPFFYVIRPFPTHLYLVAIAKLLLLHPFLGTLLIPVLLIKLKNSGCPKMHEGEKISISRIVTNV